MSISKKIAVVILTLVCGVMLLFAFEVFMMANGEKLMPLMEESIGKTTSEINIFSPGLLSLTFTLIKVVSSLLLSLSVGILILLYGPFKKSKRWASIAIFTPLIIWLSTAVLIYKNQQAAPWQIWLVLWVLAVIALVLTLSEKKKSSEHSN